MYNYRIISGFHGVSGTKATWKVTNGHFNDINKSTTLSQNVDLLSADIVWTKADEIGTISYSYTNGGGSYSGSYTVSIRGSSSGGGGGGSREGVAPLDGPKEVWIGDVVTYTTDKKMDTKNKYDETNWYFDYEYFEEVERTDTKIKIKAKNKPISKTEVRVSVEFLGPGQQLQGGITYPLYRYKNTINVAIKAHRIVESKRGVCDNNTVSYSIEGLEYTPGATITWRAGDNMSFVSGQGTSKAVFKALRTGLTQEGIVYADIRYNNDVITVENSRVWIGPEAIPVIDGDLGTRGQATLNNEYGFWTNNLFKNNIERYRWGYGSHTSSNSTETNINFAVLPSPSSGTSFNVTVSVKNPCGWSPTKSMVYSIASGGKGGGPVGPLKNAQVVDEDQSEVKSVKVYSLSGVLVYSNGAVNGVFDIKSIALNDGIYIIEKFDGKNRTSEKIMLKR